MATKTTRVLKYCSENGVIVYNRRQWRSRHRFIYQWRRLNRRHNLLNGRPSDTLVCHITDTNRTNNFIYDMVYVETIGFNRFGSGVSYNFVIDAITGTIGLGQALDAAGTHTVNYKNKPGFSYNQNYVALAIAFIGREGTIPSEQAIKSAGILIAGLKKHNALTPTFDFVPHSDFAWKSCPTENIRKRMPDMVKISNSYS